MTVILLSGFQNFSLAEIDSLQTESKIEFQDSENPIYNRKFKNKKSKFKNKSRTPNATAKNRLSNQSKSARNFISSTNKKHARGKKEVRNKQQKQKRFSKRTSFYKIKKLNFDKKRLGKQRKRVRNLENSKH